MRFLRNLPIKRKLTVLTMLTSGVALLLACLTFVVYEQIAFRRTITQDMSVLTDLFDDNVASGLEFNDPKSIEQTLKSLDAHPHVVAAAVYDLTGQVVARYQRAGPKKPFSFPQAEETGVHFGNDRLEAFRKVMLAGEAVGTIYIGSDLKELTTRFWRYAIIVTIVLLASSLVAFLLSGRLQRVISGPISQLADIASVVAADKDYSVRAVKESEDEMGRLIDGFNEMLSQIQERDTALQAARDDLEKRVEQRTGELANSFSLLNATLDSTADGILALQLTGEVVCYNAKFAAMWAIPSGVQDRQDSAETMAFVASLVMDSEQFLNRIAELQARPGAEAFDVIELKDGRTFERYIQPQRIAGKSVGMVINFRDITERKRAELELENVHRQLLDTSRQAGMAEVATGVLHNVGNVLNSVNVAATLIADQTRKSKVANLSRVVDLMRERNGDLGAFLTSDPKGKQLPAYLTQLAEHLSGEQASTLKELEQLKKNIEHIKDIVAMQQSYARVSGISETVKVTDLVEDALRMNAGALARHDVQLLREYDSRDVEITVEKHKVLQILVNLIRNAKYACDESGRNDKRLTIRVTNGDDRVRIAVADNGVGIPAENLTRIFNHGFTTRKDGHGFGLHSGALAAKEMGGALRVHSDGPGLGATFTLELSIQQTAKAT